MFFALVELGLCVHDVSAAEKLSTLLGLETDGEVGVIRPNNKRLWKLHQALEKGYYES